MYPLWQHRPHGILVHYTVTMCINRVKKKHPAHAQPSRLVHISWAAAVSGIPLRRHLWQRVRFLSAASVSLSHRAAKMKLGITCGWFNARVNRLRLPGAPAQLWIHKFYMILLVTVFRRRLRSCPTKQLCWRHANTSPCVFFFPFLQIDVHCGPLRETLTEVCPRQKRKQNE